MYVVRELLDELELRAYCKMLIARTVPVPLARASGYVDTAPKMDNEGNERQGRECHCNALSTSWNIHLPFCILSSVLPFSDTA